MEGYAVCTVHGAGTKKRVKDGTKSQPGAPLKSGRYADKLRHPAIADLIKEFENDPDPMNLLSELAASRALFTDFVNRYEAFITALLAWHESWAQGTQQIDWQDVQAMTTLIDIAEENGGPSSSLIKQARAIIEKFNLVAQVQKPRQVLDVTDSYRILAEATKIAERIKKMEFLDAIGKRDLGRVMGEMAKVVAKHVTDELAQEAIAKEWREIRI